MRKFNLIIILAFAISVFGAAAAETPASPEGPEAPKPPKKLPSA